MKQLKFALLFFAVIFLSSCFDIEEYIVINKDNSGTYSVKVDMSRLGAMMSAMGAGKDSDKPKEKKDTTIYFKDYVDTASTLTAEEKALYRDAYVKVYIDEAAGEMNLGATCPFKDIKQLADIKNNLMTIAEKFDLMDKAMGKDKAVDEQKDEEDMFDLNKSMSVPKSDNLLGLSGAVFTAEPGKISSIIPDVTAFKEAIAKDSSLKSMQQMMALMGNGMNFKTVIKLPAKIKKQEGPASSLSADNETVTYSYTLNDIFKEPEKISYKVEY